MKDPLSMRAGAVLVLCAIDGLGKYLALTEAKMKEAWDNERHAIESRPPARDQEEHDDRGSEISNADTVYETELYPAMRYSFVVLLHIFTETQLRNFCSDLQSERRVPVGVTDLKGSAIEQIKIFLTKLAGVGEKDFPENEWEKLKTLQKIRNWVVHRYGVAGELEAGDRKLLRKLVSENIGVSITPEGRILVSENYCKRQLANLRNLFEHLFEAVGWA